MKKVFYFFEFLFRFLITLWYTWNKKYELPQLICRVIKKVYDTTTPYNYSFK